MAELRGETRPGQSVFPGKEIADDDKKLGQEVINCGKSSYRPQISEFSIGNGDNEAGDSLGNTGDGVERKGVAGGGREAFFFPISGYVLRILYWFLLVLLIIKYIQRGKEKFGRCPGNVLFQE